MNIKWTRPTESGLCDRLNDVVCMATYAKCRGGVLLFDWPIFKAKDIDVAHRRDDILWENVKKFINLPKNVLVNTRTRANETFDCYIGGTSDIHGFWDAYLKNVCSFDVCQEHYQSICKDFTFCQSISDFMATLPDHFMTFHIRRGDKVRTEQHDNTYIHQNELSWLDEKTYKAIDYFAEKEDTFFICGDEDHKTAPFAEYIKAKGKKIITLPELPKWQSTYYDIAVMTKSSHNITSQRYSSFSRFPSQIGGGKFDSIFHFAAIGLI